jgi:hypothetical protein
MQHAPYTNFQATPDFALFQFSSGGPTLPEAIVRQVRFNSHQNGRIYHVDIRNKQAEKKDDPSWPDSKEFLHVVATTIQIIEIYSERYPRRILRFCGDSRLKALIFGAILTRFHQLLCPLFVIETETPESIDEEEDARAYAFLIKRKPLPFFSVQTVETKWKGSSRIFNNRYSIDLEKCIRVGLTVPTI